MNGFDRTKLLFRRYFFRLKPVLKVLASIPNRIGLTTSRHSIKLACFIWFLAVLAILGWIYGIHSSPWWPYFELSREAVTFIRTENRAEDLRNLLWAISFIGGALAAVIALINALRRTRLMQRQQDAEVFAKAVEQLGSKERAVRIGAIYALEGLMRTDFNEPGRDGMMGCQIGETLAAFIRSKSPNSEKNTSKNNNTFLPRSEKGQYPRPHADIEAAFFAITRSWPFKFRPDSHYGEGIDLSNTNLAGLYISKNSDLRKINLSNSNLESSSLEECDFRFSKIINASFINSYLLGSVFKDCRLYGSNFSFSGCHEVDFSESDLCNTDFSHSKAGGCNFSNCDLIGANFSKSFLISSNFNNSNISNSFFDKSMICKSSFMNTTMNSASLTGADISGVIIDTTRNQEIISCISKARWDHDDPPLNIINLPHRGDGQSGSTKAYDESWKSIVGPWADS